MVNIEIRLIIFFAVKDGEALYSQQNQDWELTVAQNMNREFAKIYACYIESFTLFNSLFQQHKKRLYTWTSLDGQHWNQLIIFFAAKDGDTLYSQQKQDQELTVAQIMNSLLPNSDVNWRK